jgi:hypothetical protein
LTNTCLTGSHDLSDPHGRRAHLASERLVIGEGAASKNHPLGATLVVAVDAPLKAEGEHVFHLSLDRVLITAMPITVLRDDARNELPHAAQIRAKWMFELGMSEEEINRFVTRRITARLPTKRPPISARFGECVLQIGPSKPRVRVWKYASSSVIQPWPPVAAKTTSCGPC